MSEMQNDDQAIMAKEMSTMDRPIPGESLTHDPEQPRAFEQAPKFTSAKKAQEEIFVKLTEEENFVPIMQLIDASEATIMDVTQNLLSAGFSAGKWNPDLMLMLVEPTAYMLMALAERAGIDYKIDNEPDEEDMEDKSNALSQEIAKKTPKSKTIPKTAISPEIVKKIENSSVASLMEKPSQSAESPVEGGEEPASLMEKPVG